MTARWNWLLAGLLFLTLVAYGQETVPSGTIIPVALDGTLSSKNAKPNQKIVARVMQDVPLPNGQKIRERTKIEGHVIDVRPGTQGTSPSISFTFDRIVISKKAVPVTTDLRAVASIGAVDEAQLPLFGMGEGESWNARTTTQVGGDTVYWGGGPVISSTGLVGKPLEGADTGVLVTVSAKPGTPCRGEFGENRGPQALWVFSSDACGAYQLDDVKIEHAGRNEPMGVIELSSPHGNAKIPSGTGMLLRVIEKR
jgi:hypothetical protein